MIQAVRRVLPVLFALSALGAHAQYFKTHGFSVSVGAQSPFTRTLTTNPTSGTYNVFSTTTGSTVATTVSNQQQFTTETVGFVSSVQFHPKPWAGVEFNYGYSQNAERFAFNYSGTSVPASAHTLNYQTDMHEMTAAYQFHPKHIPFQPFVNIGGGSLAFVNQSLPNQFRGAGLLEAGFDVPTHNSHIGFRIEGRSLYYRAPNFYSAAISTRSWRATVEPSVSTYYRF